MKFSGNIFTGTGNRCFNFGSDPKSLPGYRIFRILLSSEIEPLSVNVYVSP